MTASACDCGAPCEACFNAEMNTSTADEPGDMIVVGALIATAHLVANARHGTAFSHLCARHAAMFNHGIDKLGDAIRRIYDRDGNGPPTPSRHNVH